MYVDLYRISAEDAQHSVKVLDELYARLDSSAKQRDAAAQAAKEPGKPTPKPAGLVDIHYVTASR